MIDKIGALQPYGINPGRADQVANSGRLQTSGNVSTSNAEGSLASVIKPMIEQGMPIDMARVQYIQSAIAEGQYPVDPLAIASKMIAFYDAGTDLS
ncbi:flagellar biosynthesis anti-sigma factor FlgM [Parasphingorhabdus sp.]|uniref:flagellar biosynthesis anti-sigma factor FlgM n=1 Tax=Parasphingorhabdus sp. TaxID=2709688 RepID=UPI003BAF1226